MAVTQYPALLNKTYFNQTPFISSFICCVLQLKYFDDNVARCMQCLDAVESQDLTHKCEFFTKLAHTIPQFPRVSQTSRFFSIVLQGTNYGNLHIAFALFPCGVMG